MLVAEDPAPASFEDGMYGTAVPAVDCPVRHDVGLHQPQHSGQEFVASSRGKVQRVFAGQSSLDTF